MEVKRRPKTWIVVADGQRARIYRITKGGQAVEPVSGELSSQAARLPTRELGTDRAGVLHSSRGGVARAVEQTDWHRQEMARFARNVAAFINDAALGKSFDRLVLAAPPKTLGELRAALNDSAVERIKAVVPKDLSAIEPSHLLDHLSDVPLGPVKVVRHSV